MNASTKRKTTHGSVLVFSLIILTIMLSAALSILSVTLMERKSSLSTKSSTQSFNVAQSGVERVMKYIYKQAASTNTLADLAASVAGASTQCVSGNGGNPAVISIASVAGGSAELTFKDMAGTDISLCTTSILNVVSVRSLGTSSGSSRAIETAFAAAGDYQVVGGNAGNFCRINTKNGDVSCKGYSNGPGTWATYVKPWSAGTAGSYGLSCDMNSGWLACCRIDTSSGTANCKMTSGTSTAWSAMTDPSF